jgi:TolB protein
VKSRTLTIGVGLGIVALCAGLAVPASAAFQQEISVEPIVVVDRRGDQRNARISGDLVVWQDDRDPIADEMELRSDIYARDLATGAELKITDNHTASHPDISGNLVVYEDGREGDADIRIYDITTGEASWIVRRTGSDQLRPAVDGTIVVWQDSRDGSWRIRGRDLTRNRDFSLARGRGDQINPRVSGGIVVWQEVAGDTSNVFAQSLDHHAAVQITDTGDAHDPDISGTWVVYRRVTNRNVDVYGYDLATGERRRLNGSRRDTRYGPRISDRLVVWADRRNGEDFDVIGYDLLTGIEILIERAAGDQWDPAVSGAWVVWTANGGNRGLQILGAALSLTDLDMATVPLPAVTPPAVTQPPATTPAPVARTGPPCPPATSLPGFMRDARYFAQTGYRIDHDAIWEYFLLRGGVRTFGYPVSRTVFFLGRPTQFFQRQVAQIGPSGSVQLVNILDEDVMPARTINGSVYPGIDAGLKAATPSVDEPDYARRMIELLAATAPESWQGQPVRFFSTFMGQATLLEAFPGGSGDPSLLPLLNLELAGAPTSTPSADPRNASFVYQRFQRTILHYDAATGLTQPVLLADYLKDVLRGRAPADLADQMAGSRFLGQYDPEWPLALRRPEVLPDTDLCGAFEPQ